jgi:hypothetical protein
MSGSDVRLNGLCGWVLRRRPFTEEMHAQTGTAALFEWRCPTCARAFREKHERPPASAIRPRVSHPPAA